MTINITQDHIANGEKMACRRCPAALAIADATGIRDVYVNGASVGFYLHSHRESVSMCPGSLATFVRDFDAGYDVEPLSFDLEVPNA